MVPACAPDLPRALGGVPGGLAEAVLRPAPARPALLGLAGLVATACPGPGIPHSATAAMPGPATSVCLGSSERQAQWLRLPPPSELQRWMGIEPGRVPAGWARWAEKVLPVQGGLAQGPGCRGALGSGACRREWSTTATGSPPGALRPSRGHIPYPPAARSRRGRCLRHLRFYDRGPIRPGPGRGRGTAPEGWAAGQAGQGPGLRR